MNKVKKIIVSLIVIITIILMMYNLSYAYPYDSSMPFNNYNLGDDVSIDYSEYAYNSDIYCFEAMQDWGAYYKVSSKISINGTESIDTEGTKIDNIANAKLAYILSDATYYDDYEEYYGEDYPIQHALWQYENIWMNEVGRNYLPKSFNIGNGTDADWQEKYGTETVNEVIKILKNADDYANRIKEEEKFTDNTDISNVKVINCMLEDKEYFLIGDFKWTFGGTLTDIKVYDQDNKKIENISYAKYNEGVIKEVSVSDIKTDEEFGILIPKDSGVNLIKRIIGTEKIDSKNVDIIFLECTWGGQNVIIAFPKSDVKDINMSFDYNIPINSGLKIIKVDKDNKEIKLSNVGFRIQNNDTGKYIRQRIIAPNGLGDVNNDGEINEADKEKIVQYFTSGVEFANEEERKRADLDFNNEIDNRDATILERYIAGMIKSKEIVYVDTEQSATEFLTDKNGEIFIEGLEPGTYVAYETKNPNKYYKLSPNTTTEIEIEAGDVVTVEIENEKTYGDLYIYKVDKDNNEIKLPNVGFRIQNKDTGKYVREVKISPNGLGDVNNDGKLDEQDVQMISNHLGGIIKLTEDQQLRADVDKNEEISIIDSSLLDRYIRGIDTEEIGYVNNSGDATVFRTDSNGEIHIENLEKGTYIAIETNNPNRGYELSPGEVAEIEIPAGEVVSKTIENELIYIDLSGYVWVDKISSKRSERDDLYVKNGENDSQDILLNGVTVRLKDRTTNKTVEVEGKEMETKTSGAGAYKFEDLLKTEVDKYYVEFEYDGLVYENAKPYINKNNGSKAAEPTREDFNNSFAVVEPGSNSNESNIKDTSGNKSHTVYYNDISDHVRTVDHEKSYFGITSNTDKTGYKIDAKNAQKTENGKEEIKNINLGLYEREMPDIELRKDLANIELSINGFHHVYMYGSNRINNYEITNEGNDEFNVGVRFPARYTGEYKRAVYKPDYNYTLANQDDDNKLNVYLTYEILMVNASSKDLVAKVNSVVDYYDKNFTIEKVGTSINEETGEITGSELARTDLGESGNYKKALITSNMEIKGEEAGKIYIRFKLNDEEVLNEFSEGELEYKNIAEINSYSLFKDNKAYAGIDKDSAPGNSIPGNGNTYEDDTDKAPDVKLQVTGTRTVSGSVFLDEATAENPGGEARMRLGDGIYDPSKEHGIENVKVTLMNLDGSVAKIYDDENGTEKDAIAYTKSDGSFEINGIVPGNYKLKYTWGNQEYSVKDYKGTIVDETRWKENEKDAFWYRKDIEDRYSDAIDDYNIRKEIDKEDSEITTMDSTTAAMTLDFEINSVYSVVPNVDRFEPEGYNVKNTDFGIIERARLALNISKNVKTVKVTLANGQVIVDATIDDNGNLVGTNSNLIYIKPEGSIGQLWIQLDNELIQGAKVQVGYEIKVSNNSELDYDSEGYYQYGQYRYNPIKITPSGVYDYLDGMVLDTSKPDENGDWEVISENEYNEVNEGPTIVEEFFYNDEDGMWVEEISTYQEVIEYWTRSSTESRIDAEAIRKEKLKNKIILENANLEKELEPGESNAVVLYASTILSNSNEIDLNNSVEITDIRTNSETGRTVTPYTSILVTMAPPTTITPPTGENNNYILIITTVSVALVILGIGVILIKRKVL